VRWGDAWLARSTARDDDVYLACRVNSERARVTTKKIFSAVYYLRDISNYISNNVL